MKRTTAWLFALALAIYGAVVLRGGRADGGGFNPCLTPLQWDIGRVDARFDISRDELRQAVEAAARVWESPTDRQFFRHDSIDGWPIELVYDQRQAMTEVEGSRRRRLEALNVEIERRQRTHERLQHESRRAVAAYERQVAAFHEELESHNAAVEHWNERGGAPAPVRRRLRERVAEINRNRSELDRLASSLEERRARLEEAARRLQQAIDDYNTLAREQRRAGPRLVESGSFQETVVTRGGRSAHTDRRLTVFQFAGSEELVHVLAHELGHALGLDHVPEPGAIMHEQYRSADVDRPLRPHDADLVALIRRCGVDVWKATLPSRAGP